MLKSPISPDDILKQANDWNYPDNGGINWDPEDCAYIAHVINRYHAQWISGEFESLQWPIPVGDKDVKLSELSDVDALARVISLQIKYGDNRDKMYRELNWSLASMCDILFGLFLSGM